MKTLSLRNTPDARTMRRNILRARLNATPADIVQGTLWYPKAERIASRISGGSPFIGAAVLSAVSARVPWSRNVSIARDILHGMPREAIGCMDSAYVRACRILHGEHPDHVLTGRKQYAFYRNIIGDYHHVTVDIWALRAAIGSTDYDKLSPAAYGVIAAAYRAVANRIGEPAAITQAIVWCAVRGASE